VDYDAALRYLDANANYERTGKVDTPSVEGIAKLMDIMGNPHLAYPVIHITGTNGKGSTAQIITRILMAHGLTVGTYSSPHLHRVNERITRDCEPISDEEFGRVMGEVADLETLGGVSPSYFDILTAAGFSWFADAGIDVAVIEVGMLGRWDATNVVQSAVTVVTNVALDHTDYAGPTRVHIAREKSGIAKPDAPMVLGENDSETLNEFMAAGAKELVIRGEHFDCVDNHLALGGRMIDVKTSRADYRELFVPLHGRHQGLNASIAIAAVEEFFAAPINIDVLVEGLSSVQMPGRFEVLGHQPLVIIDGAHNPAGADICAEVFFDDFDPVGRRILLVGCLVGRDMTALLSALRADEFDSVVCVTAPSPRGVAAEELAAHAKALGCDDVVAVTSVARGCEVALNNATSDDAVLITGSLYVIGEAREHLRRILP
jgi:dihydrofolate synthase/folylpolyglutamate synthase